MAKTALRIVAWACLALIVFVSLGPVAIRPESPVGVEPERFVAFAVLGLLFGLAHPRRIILIACLVVASAITIELAQNLVVGRHGRLIDGAVKVAGAGFGTGLAAIVGTIFPTFRGQKS